MNEMHQARHRPLETCFIIASNHTIRNRHMRSAIRQVIRQDFISKKCSCKMYTNDYDFLSALCQSMVPGA